MVFIRKANITDALLIAHIGARTFVETHGHSAASKDIKAYVNEKFNEDLLRQELNNPGKVYDLIFYNGRPAGYSKILFNASHPNIALSNVTNLDRFYLLKEFYGHGLGYQLLKFLVQLSQQNNQAGMWLFVWKENQRAIDFYTKTGFRVVGSYDFHVTATHANPNHQMLLEY